MLEPQILGGAHRDPIDERDHIYDKEAVGAFELDWEKGFDVRDVIGADVFQNNQGATMSCVGQGAAQYAWVLNIIELEKQYNCTYEELQQYHPNEIERMSAKAIYSMISLGRYKGAYIRDGALQIKSWGSLMERFCPSYKPDGTTDEDWMIDQSWRTPDMEALAMVFKAKDAQVINNKTDINVHGQAVIKNYGVLCGVDGANGHGWGTERPTPPNQGEPTWGHCLYFAAFGTDEKGKFIAFPNSYGKIVQETWKPGSKPGTGWQKIYEDYFLSGNVFNPWTITDDTNQVSHLIQ